MDWTVTIRDPGLEIVEILMSTAIVMCGINPELAGDLTAEAVRVLDNSLPFGTKP